MNWNDETIARLRQFWTEGHSTAEIGRRMGISKNAVVGKAHRLDLAARPSPIRRAVVDATMPRASAPRRMTGPTLPSLASVQAPAPRAAPQVSEPPARPIAAPPGLRAVATRSARCIPCCWPIGEPGTKAFRFCDADATAGKPYCAEHAQIAYVRVRDRREEAA